MTKRKTHQSSRNISSTPRIRAFIVCSIASLVLLVFGSYGMTSSFASSVRGAVQSITLPVKYLGAILFSPFSAVSENIQDYSADEETLTALKAENEKLKSENTQYKEAAATASRLQSLLKFKDNYKLDAVGARVISGSVDSFSKTVTIDKGTLQGLKVGMPVTDGYGILGQIIECGPFSSVIRLITDERLNISALVQSSRAQGEIQGNGENSLKMNLIRTDQKVSVGDIIVTSGLGGVFPKGLPLGTVTAVERPVGALYYDVSVKPLAYTSNFEEVMVIISITQDQVSTSDETANANAQEKGTAPYKEPAKTTPQDSKGDSGAGDGGDSDDNTNADDGTNDENTDNNDDKDDEDNTDNNEDNGEGE